MNTLKQLEQLRLQRADLAEQYDDRAAVEIFGEFAYTNAKDGLL